MNGISFGYRFESLGEDRLGGGWGVSVCTARSSFNGFRALPSLKSTISDGLEEGDQWRVAVVGIQETLWLL